MTATFDPNNFIQFLKVFFRNFHKHFRILYFQKNVESDARVYVSFNPWGIREFSEMFIAAINNALPTLTTVLLKDKILQIILQDDI